MAITIDQEEINRQINEDPEKWIEIAGVYRTQEFIDTMLHRIPDANFVIRKEFIKQYCADKKVLHLGCRGQSTEPNALHGELNNICKEIWGLDIVKCEIDRFIQADLNEAGWSKDLNDGSFDLLLATEILEHLPNAGNFIKECREFNCEVLLTVPNAFGYNRYKIMQVGIEYDNVQHLACYSFSTIKRLIQRYGFRISQFYWADYPMQFFAKGLVFVLSPV